MGGYLWNQESESDSNEEPKKNNDTPFNHNYNINFDNNKNKTNDNLPKSSAINLFLGEKHKRPISQSENIHLNNLNNNYLDNQSKMKRLNINPQSQQNIIQNNQQNQNENLISELLKENKKLKQENEKNQQIINNYNKKFETIEKEIEKKVSDALNKFNSEKDKNNKQIRSIIKDAMKQYQLDNEEKLNLIIKEIPEKMEKDIQKKTKELENLYYNKFKNEKQSNFEVHSGIKCQKCFITPIIGIRYKCSVCNNYNLCEKCEKENSESMYHPHIFLKYAKKEEQIMLNEEDEENNNEKKNDIINKYNNKKKEIKKSNIIFDFNEIGNNYKNKKEEIINTDIKEKKEEDNNINNLKKIGEKKNDLNNYSYQCLNDKLSFSIIQGEKETKYNLYLKNNGSIPWPKNKTFLIADTSLSEKVIDDIYLDPLNPGDEYTVNLYYHDLELLKPGKYNTYLDFIIENKNIGEKILIILEVVEKKDTYKYDPKIAGFRNTFGGIDDKTMSDEVIKNALEKNNNDFQKAFQSLFQD